MINQIFHVIQKCYSLHNHAVTATLYSILINQGRKWTKYLHISYTVLCYKRQVTAKYGTIQACNQGVKLSAKHPPQTWMHTLQICTLSKISPLKAMWHPNTSKCCLYWTITLWNISVSKITVQYARCFCVILCSMLYTGVPGGKDLYLTYIPFTLVVSSDSCQAQFISP